MGVDNASGLDKTVVVKPKNRASAGSKQSGKLAHYQAAMSADLAKLSTLDDIDAKASAKRQMLDTYWSFVNDYVDSCAKYANDIAVRVCIWLFDMKDIERALDLAFYLIAQGCQVMPPKFDRDLPTFVCDAVYDWANELLKNDPPESASPYLDTLVAHIDNDHWSLSPPVQSKMYTILAKHKNREGDFLNCVALCEKAEAVNPVGAGVKTLKTQAQAKIKLAPEQPEQPEQSEQSDQSEQPEQPEQTEQTEQTDKTE